MTTTIAPPRDPRLLARTPDAPTPDSLTPPDSLPLHDSLPVQDSLGRRPIRWRWVSTALALAMVGASLVIEFGNILVLPLLFVFVVPFEKMFPRHNQKIRRPLVVQDMGYALSGPVLNFLALLVAVPVGVVSLAWVPGLLLRPLVAMIPAPLAPLIGIALFDLAIYWTHRWYHEVPFLWRFHAVHHSTEHLDWVSGFRNHPLDGTLIAPAFFFLVAAGFSAEFTGALAIVQILTGLFLHANVRWRWRLLHKVVITPEFHHWHHANEEGAINTNYSVFLPAWDLLFGTYFMPKDRRPQKYGVDEFMPSGIVAQLRHPFRGMGNLLGIVGHPIRSTKAVFGYLRHTLLPDLWRSTRRPTRRLTGH